MCGENGSWSENCGASCGSLGVLCTIWTAFAGRKKLSSLWYCTSVCQHVRSKSKDKVFDIGFIRRVKICLMIRVIMKNMPKGVFVPLVRFHFAHTCVRVSQLLARTSCILLLLSWVFARLPSSCPSLLLAASARNACSDQQDWPIAVHGERFCLFYHRALQVSIWHVATRYP
jgi:hypothetical protein